MGTVVVRDIGFTVLYEPAESTPVADFEGTKDPAASALAPKQASLRTEKSKESTRWSLKGTLATTLRVNRSVSPSVTLDEVSESEGVYWPHDLLPSDCLDARIQVWGYDSVVTKGYAAANKSNLFGHAKDLLYSLDRHRSPGRPIIFVAHSLGGLLVKEVLRRSHYAEDPALQDIVMSTKAIVFLGTPHRGSAEFAKVGELARKIAAAVLRVDSNSTIIRALGIDSPELELSRESFLQQWRQYGFQVKTFQESRPMTGVNMSVLNDKIVPDVSSSLDDPRERAETIQANHKDMARYWGAQDLNYIRVGGELKRIVKSLKACLSTLYFPTMIQRHRNIRDALTNTCIWFQNSERYRTWYSRDNIKDDHGLLWLKGKPGSGKSTLMKDAFVRIQQTELSLATVAGFFFNARGSVLERTPLGLFRSLLYQICHQDRAVLAEFLKLYLDRQKANISGEEVTWTRFELESFLKQAFKKHKPQRTIILVDAVDECDERTVREVVFLFGEICNTATDNVLELNICLSSRHYPTISIAHCPEIMMEGANQEDIALYIRDRFSFVSESERNLLRDLEINLMKKSNGVFLWAVLVSDLLLRDIDTGQPINILTERLKRVPQHMEDLYSELCNSLTLEERQLSTRLVQWLLLARSMDIEDTFLAVLFSMPWTWEGLNAWGYDSKNTPSKERLVKFLKNASRGLIEYTGETVQFIHETAREYFLAGPGLGLIDESLTLQPIGISYKELVKGCINIMEYGEDWPCFGNLNGYCQNAVVEFSKRSDSLGTNIVELLDNLQSKPSLWRKMRHGRGNILHFLCVNNLVSCVVECLARGADPNESGHNPYFSSPLVAAVSQIEEPSKLLVSHLLSSGANVNAQDRDGNTSLMISLKRNRISLATMLLDRGANIDVANNDSERGLHVVALKRSISEWKEECKQLMARLIREGAQLNEATNTGSTPLHFAALSANLDAVRLLTQNGADINHHDYEGPPLLSAVRSPREEAAEICSILIKHGTDVGFRDQKDQTLLHHAARTSPGNVVLYLIDAGVDVNTVDRLGRTALHRAAERRDDITDILRALVDAGADVRIRDNQRQSPFNVRYNFFGGMRSEERVILEARSDGKELDNFPLPNRPL
ncbi:ankyrin repeat-containing protein [Seiridium cupressi]